MGLIHTKPDPSKIPAFFEPDVTFNLDNSIKSESIQIVEEFLTQHDIGNLTELFKSSPVKEAVSIQGLKDVACGIGSERTTMWSEKLAKELTIKLKQTDFENYYKSNQFSRTDSWQHVTNRRHLWELVGFSPMLRFMSYLDGGEHYAHYDAGYIYADTNYRTLKSVVIYLTTNTTGATRFVIDNQDDIVQSDRINLDWAVEAEPEQIAKESFPKAGNMLVFDHRLCHDVSKFIPKNEFEKRIIIRGDLIYKLVK